MRCLASASCRNGASIAICRGKVGLQAWDVDDQQLVVEEIYRGHVPCHPPSLASLVKGAALDGWR